MQKDFMKVNSILQVEGLEFSNGKVELTEEQMKAINDKLDGLESDNQKRKRRLMSKKLRSKISRMVRVTRLFMSMGMKVVRKK